MEALSDLELSRIEHATERAHGHMVMLDSREILSLIAEVKSAREVPGIQAKLTAAESKIDQMEKALLAAGEIIEQIPDTQKYRQARKEVEALP